MVLLYGASLRVPKYQPAYDQKYLIHQLSIEYDVTRKPELIIWGQILFFDHNEWSRILRPSQLRPSSCCAAGRRGYGSASSWRQAAMRASARALRQRRRARTGPEEGRHPHPASAPADEHCSVGIIYRNMYTWGRESGFSASDSVLRVVLVMNALVAVRKHGRPVPAVGARLA